MSLLANPEYGHQPETPGLSRALELYCDALRLRANTDEDGNLPSLTEQDFFDVTNECLPDDQASGEVVRQGGMTLVYTGDEGNVKPFLGPGERLADFVERHLVSTDLTALLVDAIRDVALSLPNFEVNTLTEAEIESYRELFSEEELEQVVAAHVLEESGTTKNHKLAAHTLDAYEHDALLDSFRFNSLLVTYLEEEDAKRFEDMYDANYLSTQLPLFSNKSEHYFGLAAVPRSKDLWSEAKKLAQEEGISERECYRILELRELGSSSNRFRVKSPVKLKELSTLLVKDERFAFLFKKCIVDAIGVLGKLTVTTAGMWLVY